jgi:RNA polymerase sigma-70 factor (ECF subfamily)
MDALEDRIGRHLDAGDLSSAATEIVRGYGAEIVGYLVVLARDEERANDVFSQCCEDVWRGLPRFRREASTRTWLYKLAWYAWLRHQRDPYRRRGERLVTEQMSRLAAEVRSTTAQYLRSENKDAIARLRDQLAADEQSLLILRVDRSLTWSEIASIMSTPEDKVDAQTLAKRFERLKAKLRCMAEQAGLLQKK